jgi:hypothetical protein
LRVGRVDLQRGSVEVRESLADVKGRLVFGSTKTYAHRTVRLPRFLTSELAVHLDDRPHRPDDLVFTGRPGHRCGITSSTSGTSSRPSSERACPRACDFTTEGTRARRCWLHKEHTRRR